MPMRSSETWTWTPLTPPPLPKAPDTYVSATELPAGHRQVLLKLRRGELAAKILDHLREQAIPEPQKSDWVAAIERGHVVRRDGRLQLTPSGGHAVGQIMRDLGKKFGIHHLTTHHVGASMGPRVVCTCGWGAHYGKTSSAESTLARFAAEHLLKVNAEARGT